MTAAVTQGNLTIVVVTLSIEAVVVVAPAAPVSQELGVVLCIFLEEQGPRLYVLKRPQNVMLAYIRAHTSQILYFVFEDLIVLLRVPPTILTASPASRLLCTPNDSFVRVLTYFGMYYVLLLSVTKRGNDFGRG